MTNINFVYATKKRTALDHILAQGASFFDQAGVPFEVIIPQDFCTSFVETHLTNMGYIQKAQAVAMVFSLQSVPADHVASFDEDLIIKAQEDSLDAWVTPLTEAFDASPETSRGYQSAHERALRKGLQLHHFCLFKQEKPVASITLSLCGPLARLDDVGTLPAFQGKGYATHLIRYALSQAKQRGAQSCFLESSASGLSVYETLGFTPLFTNNVYTRNT
ncbi:MAG: GNAT family N-acetyltransferase [Alphaproteobacteria bacterium]|nr:GNAT family N-acetyltransferase [Alphaproteobacteria bacterium]